MQEAGSPIAREIAASNWSLSTPFGAPGEQAQRLRPARPRAAKPKAPRRRVARRWAGVRWADMGSQYAGSWSDSTHAPPRSLQPRLDAAASARRYAQVNADNRRKGERAWTAIRRAVVSSKRVW